MSVSWTKEQEQVIHLRNRNLLISAAAGSGKTAVLVERIIKMITDERNPLDIDRLLIVTFTRAAANEMRERIGSAIEGCLDKQPDNEHLQRQATLIHNAQINTIDGFCAYVIKNYFHTIDLDPSYRVGEEGEFALLKADVITKVLEEEYQNLDDEFLHFVESYAHGKSDKVLEELILELHNFSMSDLYPSEWLDACLIPYEIKEFKRLEKPVWLQIFWKEVDRILEEAKGIVEENLHVCQLVDGPQMYEPMVQEVSAYLGALDNAKDYDEYYSILKNMKFTALSRKKSEDISVELREQVKNQHTKVKDILKELQSDYFSNPLESTLNILEENKRCIKVLIDLTKKFQVAFSKAKRSKNLMDFPDLEHIALKILLEKDGDRLVRTQAALDFSKQFDEIMIDEYQDSNMVQEYILTAISRIEDGNYNMFMVGDVKQSIYRFRLARPELFMGKLATYTKADGVCQRIDLHKNFRSRENVLQTSNLIFEQIMGKDLGSITYDSDAALYYGAKYETCANPDFPQTELLCLEVDSDKEEGEENSLEQSKEGYRRLEARVIAKRIQEIVGTEEIYDIKTQKKRLARYSDCVILLRTLSGWADVFTKVLNDLGVPAYSTSKTGYFTAIEVQTVLNFLHICDNRRQEIPFTAILTSPIVGLTTNELAIVKAKYLQLPIYMAVEEYVKTGEDESLVAKLKEFSELLQELRDMVAYTPIHDFINIILERTQYATYVSAMPGGEQRSANLTMLVEKAMEFENTSYRGLFNFIRYIEKLQKYDVDFGEVSTINENANTVRIMSIHKSKGLEFPVVFVAGMGKTFNMQDTKGNLVCHADCGIGLNYINPILRTKSSTVIRNMIIKLLKNENLGEELRILYVALTRAKEKLILTGYIKKIEDKVKSYIGLLGYKDVLLPYSIRTGATTYWDLVLPALARTQSFKSLYDRYDLVGNAQGYQGVTDANIIIKVLDSTSFIKEEVKRQVDDHITKEQLLNWDTSYIYHDKLHECIEERFDFVYPYLNQKDIPAKLSVSELKHESMEDEGATMLFEEEIVPIIPSFMEDKETKVLIGAKRGTAYHKVMECLDFTKAHTKDEIIQQIQEFIEEGRMTKEMEECIKVQDIASLCQSDIGKRLEQAQKNHVLYREQPFVIGVSANTKDKEWSEDETILVQGIIDVYFEEDNKIVLLDYKTDKVYKDEKELIEKYQVQLEYYSLALKQLTGKEVRETVIYSFTLGREVKL